VSAGHDHSHGMTGKKLRTAFLLTILILVVELSAGVVSHSLALLSDAGHVMTDLIALGLAWFATVQAERPADARKTYGYHRTGILTALANAVSLIMIVVAIAYEAFKRLQQPEPVAPWLMFVAAAVGIAVNLYIGFGLRSEGEDNLNVRAAILHVFGDVGASAGVIVGGLVIVFTRWYPADPIISLGIAALIAVGAWGILHETIDILMESTPRHMDIPEMVRDMMALSSVKDVHDLHVWSIAGGIPVLTAHVQVQEDCAVSRCDATLVALNQMLKEKYGVSHTTIQFECDGCDPNHLYCTLPAHDHVHAPLLSEAGVTGASRGVGTPEQCR